MAERPKFGIHTPERTQHAKADQPAAMFPDGADLPLFSGTPIPAIERPFVPEDQSMKQAMLPGMPSVDYEYVLERETGRCAGGALQSQYHQAMISLLPSRQ
jgi:hypothetical protein